MIRRKRVSKKYSKEYKEKIVLELVSGQSKVSQIAQREGLHPQTIRNWKKEFDNGKFRAQNEEELRLRKRIAELESALSDMELENQILKKTQKLVKELKLSDS